MHVTLSRIQIEAWHCIEAHNRSRSADNSRAIFPINCDAINNDTVLIVGFFASLPPLFMTDSNAFLTAIRFRVFMAGAGSFGNAFEKDGTYYISIMYREGSRLS